MSNGIGFFAGILKTKTNNKISYYLSTFVIGGAYEDQGFEFMALLMVSGRSSFYAGRSVKSQRC